MQFRRTRKQDLPFCAALIEERSLYRDDEIPDLIRMWSELLNSGAAYSSVVVDERSGAPLAFGISAFVDDAKADAYRSEPTLRIVREVFERWREGRSILLDDAALGRANAGQGVNCVVLASGWKHAAESVRQMEAMKLIESFVDVHLGLYFRTFTHQVFGGMPFPPQALDLEITMNADKPEHDGSPPWTLMTLRRNERTIDNFINAQLFLSPARPQFFFDARARAVLSLAMDGLTDEEIAGEVGISVNGLKKRWQQIYDVIRDADSDLLTVASSKNDDGKRGAELRRVVLAYVRGHREELHPYDRSATQRTSNANSPGIATGQLDRPAAKS